jgi:hypothetical protein
MQDASVRQYLAGGRGLVVVAALVVGVLGLVSSACGVSELAPLVREGPEWHDSLVTRELSEIRHVPGSVVRANPYLSAEPEFIKAIGRGSSQGRLEGRGVRLALYALYRAERDLGMYGLEAASEADADRLEDALRGVWAHNAGLGRARVHRGNKVLVVVWHDGVSPDCWEAVNSGIVERLDVP